MSKPIFLKSKFSRKFSAVITSCLLLVLLAGFLFPGTATAASADVIGGPTTVIRKITDFVQNKLLTALKKAASAAFQSTLSSTVNKLAYDMATYIGSGSKGQQPLAMRDPWGTIAKNAGQAASAGLVEGLNTWANINLCEPNLDVKARIGLGLVQYADPGSMTYGCDLKKARDAWKNDIEKKWAAMQDKEYWARTVQDTFNPTSNDLTISFSLMSGMDYEAKKKEAETLGNTQATKGWLDLRNPGGKLEGVPGSAEAAAEMSRNLTLGNVGKYTGEALVDAGNIFLNQLAITGLNTTLNNLLGDDPNSEGPDWGSLKEGFLNGITNPDADSSAFSNVSSKLASLAKPKFDVKTNYSILNDLASCPDPTNPGPTNCVIDDKFRQGIEEQKTVIEAMNDGYLNQDWNFKGKIDYNQGYSLRSAVILRKYRVVPVGWEEAVRRIVSGPNNNGVPRSATLLDLVSCYDPDDQYNSFSREFDVSDQTWCLGLIDPNWVLKASLNYCKRLGYGGQLLSKSLIDMPDPDDPTGPTSKQILLTRAEDYCADEQSCIKEKEDGSCEAYGYCTEERRTWKFNSDSCTPVFNTCRTFQDTEGEAVSYLENTLDSSNCNAFNAGCKPYATTGDYDSANDKMTWKKSGQTFLNNNAEKCTADQEGCTQLIRVKTDYGFNLLKNSDFEDSNISAWSESIGSYSPSAASVPVTIAGGYSSNNALSIPSGNTSYRAIAVRTPFPDMAGQTFSLSMYAKGCGSTDDFSFIDPAVNAAPVVLLSKKFNVGSDWQYYTISYTYPAYSNFKEIAFMIRSHSCIIDRVKLELGSASTPYSDYGSNNVVYEKLIPNYLESACYINANNKDYRLKDNAPDKCSNYARRCNADEAGCEMYADVSGFNVAAQAKPGDYCPANCVGYDTYIQRETYFNQPKGLNLIPATAQACSLESVGCNEFTNLDELAGGGESREYYVNLRQCIKPDANQCTDYYYWEGGAGSGYELKSASLKKGTSGPAVTSSDSALCNATIYALPVSNPQFNPDCREFYDKSGVKSYHLASRTITCSNQCKPFRLSARNISSTIVTAAACTGTDKGWVSASNQCVVCQNGGLWDANQGACVYYAIPGEGQSCKAEENGCREYNGNKGSNVRLIESYDFESSSGANGFTLPAGSGLSTESTSKDGQSLKLSGTASTLVSDQVVQGRSYTLKFMAKAASATTFKVRFNRTSNPLAVTDSATFGLVKDETKVSTLTIPGNGQWQIYQLSLDSLNHEVTKDEILVFESSSLVYLDNIVLNEVTDRYYLLENSWNTPDICYYDVAGNYQGLNYNLGCSQYRDRSGMPYNLRQFSRLCNDGAVGCELMIDTKNSNNYRAAAYNKTGQTGAVVNAVCDSTDGYDCVNVPADAYVYAIYDQGKSCDSQAKGCARLGESQDSSPDLTTQIIYKDIYVKLDPEKYEQSLCKIDEVGCEAWSYNDGQNVSQSFFRDPGNQVCEWRKGSLYTQEQWYRKKVKRCSLDTNRVCLLNSDCTGFGTCQTDANDVLCPVDPLKTLGTGGKGNDIKQPTSGWVGACEASASGCTELIDPVSSFNPNMAINPTFSSDTVGTSWFTGGSVVLGEYIYQDVYLEKNKLYILETDNNNNTSINCANSPTLRVLNSNNNLGTAVSGITISAPVGGGKTKIIFLNTNKGDNDFDTFDTCTLRVIGSLASNAAGGKQVSLRAAIVDYKLQTGFDRSSCNGSANADIGCIIFNERQASSINKPLIWDAAASYGAQVNCTSGKCDANSILKVRPSRVCDKWLACATKECVRRDGQGLCLEEKCYGQGECNEMGTDGSCLSFVKKSDILHEFNPATDKNSSGYSKLNYSYFSNMIEVGQGLDEYHWSFEDDSNTTPLFDVDLSSSSSTKFCTQPTEGQVSYPAQGECYSKITMSKTKALNLKYSGTSGEATIYNPDSTGILFGARSGQFKVNRGMTYYISYLINTNAAQGNPRMLFRYYSGNAWSDAVFVNDEIERDPQENLYPSQSQSGWRRVIHKFTPTTNMAEFFLGMAGDSNNKTVYYDDINIEPMLQVASSTASGTLYVPKSCRLYPRQDSLDCKSDNPSVYPNGLYGYCLEVDPLNQDICLMWLPVDGVSSAEAEDNSASTGFNGYAGGTANPFYCIEANGNFKYLEKREARYLGSKYEYYDYGSGGYTRRYCIAPNADWNGCPTSYNLHETNSTAVIAACGSIDYLLLRFDDIWNVSGADSEYCFYHFACVPKTAGRVFASPAKTITFPDIGCNGCGKTTGDTFTVSSDGWYVHNGFTTFPTKIYYRGSNYFTIDATSELMNNAPDDPIKVFDNYNPPTSIGMLKDLTDFPPSCRAFVQGAKPWVTRLTTYNGLPYFFGKGNGTNVDVWTLPYSGYTREKTNAPYGAAKINSSSEIPSKLKLGVNEAGHPYGCVGGTGDSDGCPKIGVCANGTNAGKYCLVATGFAKGDTDQCGTGGTCLSVAVKNYNPAINKTANRELANIFFGANDVFNYSGVSIKDSSDYYYDASSSIKIIDNSFNKGATSNITACPTSGRPNCQTDPAGCFCRILPKISNVRILDQALSTNGIEINPTTKEFTIARPSFYTLRFNTVVDIEQTPISKMFISFGPPDFSRTNIDAGEHELIKLLTPGTYKLSIRVTDNWGYQVGY